MKKYLLTTLLFASVSLFAQDKLVVEYEMFTKMDMGEITAETEGMSISNKEIEDALKEAMAKPNYYQLTLSPEESTFEFIEKVDNTQTEETGRVMISFGEKGIFYKNLPEKITLRESNSWSQNYLINDSIKNYDWKITKETQEILGYETRKATAVVDSTTTIEAWYAPKLPFKNGPDDFDGLPGLILKVEQISHHNDKSTTKTYTAISIKVSDEKTKITRPKKGKKLTQEEFSKEMDEQMQKMREMYSEGVDKD